MVKKKPFPDDPKLGAVLTKILRSKPEFEPETEALHKRLADWAEQSYHSKTRMGGLDPDICGEAPRP